MNQRLVKVPFNVETARKITEGKIKGRVIDVVLNCPARILDFNFNSYVGKLNIVVSERECGEVFCACNDEGHMFLEKYGKFDERPLFVLEIPKSEEPEAYAETYQADDTEPEGEDDDTKEDY